MRLKRNHPWNPGYSLPEHILAETSGPARVTPPARRGTGLSKEIVRITPGARRGTGGRWRGEEFASSALEGLGSTSPTSKLRMPLRGAGSDPIANFGREASQAVLSAARGLHGKERLAVLRSVLDAIDANMWKDVELKMAKLKREGVPPALGIDKAVAAALANHFLAQLERAGRSGAMPVDGVLGMGSYDTSRSLAHQRLDGYLAAEGIGDMFRDFGRGVKAGVSNLGSNAKAALDKVGSMACKASANPGVQMASMANPAAATGAAILSGVCGGATGQAAAPPPPPPGPDLNKILIIGGIGVAGLAVLMIVTR